MNVTPEGSVNRAVGTAGLPSTADPLELVGDLIERYVVVPDHNARTALSLFVLHTWAFDAAHATPYLVVASAEKRSGKTRLLEILELVVREPWRTASTTEAALFRKIEEDRPTLLLDEIDAVFGVDSDRTLSGGVPPEYHFEPEYRLEYQTTLNLCLEAAYRLAVPAVVARLGAS